MGALCRAIGLGGGEDGRSPGEGRSRGGGSVDSEPRNESFAAGAAFRHNDRIDEVSQDCSAIRLNGLGL